MEEVIARIEKSGVDCGSCVYPYTATSTDLTSIVPAWALEGGYAQFVARLNGPALRQKIKEGMARLKNNGASTILVRGTGKRLNTLAHDMNLDPAEVVARLFEAAIRKMTSLAARREIRITSPKACGT